MTTQAAHIYFVVGDDPYLIDRAIGDIVGEASDLSITQFSSQDPIGIIIQALRTGSLLAERRFVIVRGLEELSADTERQLVSYIEDPSAESTAVFVSSKSLPKVAAATRKSGRIIDVSRGKRSDLTGWIRDESKARGLKIDQEGTAALLDAIGEERLALANALEELALAVGRGGKVGAREVHTHFRGRADIKIFAFIDAVANKEVGSALQTLHRLLRAGEAPQAIFWTLARHIRMLLLSEGSPIAVAKRLGIPDWRAEKLVRQGRKFTRKELIDAYGSLAEADRKMKNSEEPEELTLERIVVEIAGLRTESIVRS